MKEYKYEVFMPMNGADRASVPVRFASMRRAIKAALHVANTGRHITSYVYFLNRNGTTVSVGVGRGEKWFKIAQIIAGVPQ